MRTNKEIGNAGECAVCRYLEGEGYTVIARNYIAPHGEIDIIAANETYLVFCEVKTRKELPIPTRYGRPSRAVDEEKREHLLSAAKHYLLQTYNSLRPEKLYPRFDVAEVFYTEGTAEPKFRIHYIARAFGASSRT